MQDFNIDKFKETPNTKLVLVNHLEQAWLIPEAVIVFDKLVIRVPETGYQASEIQVAEDNVVRDKKRDIIGHVKFAPENTQTLSTIAEQVFKMKVDEEISFKLHPDRDLWGITRIRRFDTEFLFLSYYNGNNMSIFDTSEESISNVLAWMQQVIEIAPNMCVYTYNPDRDE